MAGGLRYQTGREMPPGMQEIYGVKLAEVLRKANDLNIEVDEKRASEEALLRTMSEYVRKLRDKYPVVQRLEAERIFEIEGVYRDGLSVSEACDYWFHCDLKADEVLQLAKYFEEVAFFMNGGSK